MHHLAIRERCLVWSVAYADEKFLASRQNGAEAIFRSFSNTPSSICIARWKLSNCRTNIGNFVEHDFWHCKRLQIFSVSSQFKKKQSKYCCVIAWCIPRNGKTKITKTFLSKLHHLRGENKIQFHNWQKSNKIVYFVCHLFCQHFRRILSRRKSSAQTDPFVLIVWRWNFRRRKVILGISICFFRKTTALPVNAMKQRVTYTQAVTSHLRSQSQTHRDIHFFDKETPKVVSNIYQFWSKQYYRDLDYRLHLAPSFQIRMEESPKMPFQRT